MGDMRSQEALVRMPPVLGDATRREAIKAEAFARAAATALLCGLGDWIQEVARNGQRHRPGNDDILTAEESDAVFELWAVMPGSASWADAFLRWLGESDEERRERHRRWAVLSATVVPGDQESETSAEEA